MNLFEKERAKDIKILLVEDDYLVADLIKRTITELGYNIIDRALNGEEAVSKVELLRPDIVMMDIEMPVMNGIEATRIIQEQCPTPVIILTAFETSKLINEASEAGISAYLVKPIKKYLIERSIVIAMARHKDIMKVRRLNRVLNNRNKEIEKALAEIETLRGIIPICASCKSIRDDKGYWQNVEKYISAHTSAEFSHGICPECEKKLYGQEHWYIEMKKDKDQT